MRRRCLLSSSALVLTALAFVAAGSASIVPQRSIAGIKLGLSERGVRAKLGAPIKVRTGTNIAGHWRRLIYPRVTIAFQNGDKATFIFTKSRLEKTASGVGVGSRLVQVRAGLRGETCKREFGAYHCWTGRWEPGQVVTDFVFGHSRVAQIALGYVID